MACFEEVETENIDACVGAETQAGVSEVGVFYTPFEDILTFPMPLKIGDPGYTYAKSVEVDTNIEFVAGKGWGKIVIQADSGEGLVSLVGNKGNKKEKNGISFYVAGNDAKTLGYLRTFKNRPSVYMYTERNGQKRLVGDKHNPAFIMEAAGTTGKGPEDDKGVLFTIESYGVPIIYKGDVQLPAVPNPGV